MSAHKKTIKAVIPAAGLGTRMLPATKVVPKEILPVAGKPLIQYAVEEAAASGIETVILVVRNNNSMIQAHFARDRELESFLEDRRLAAVAEGIRQLPGLADLQYVDQEKPLGLAHAISCARPLVGDEPFVVLLPDVIMVHDEPVTRQLIRAHDEHGESAVAIRGIQSTEVERYGIVRVEPSAELHVGKSVRVTGLVEKPSAATAPSLVGVFGRYLLHPAIWDVLAETPPDAKGEVQLTDALNLFCQKRPLFGLCFEGQHYDAGNRLGLLAASIELSLRDSYLRPPLLAYLSHLPRPDGENVEDKPATDQLKEENGRVKHVLADLSGSQQFS